MPSAGQEAERRNWNFSEGLLVLCWMLKQVRADDCGSWCRSGAEAAPISRLMLVRTGALGGFWRRGGAPNIPCAAALVQGLMRHRPGSRETAESTTNWAEASSGFTISLSHTHTPTHPCGAASVTWVTGITFVSDGWSKLSGGGGGGCSPPNIMRIPFVSEGFWPVHFWLEQISQLQLQSVKHAEQTLTGSCCARNLS